MSLPDPLTSRAVLIGSSRYDCLDQLPAVTNNLDRLAALLTDPEVWGLPQAHCVTVRDPGAPADVLDAVRESARSAGDTLVVYFAGHGLLDPRNADLFLALPDCDKDRLYRAVRYDDLRREVMNPGVRCPSKVVVLDCCYSGRAMSGGMGSPAQLADQARIDGTFLLTASAETKLALAPEGEPYTAFTGELIAVLEAGVAGGPAVLDLDSIYWRVRAELEAKGRPIPQQRSRNDGHTIALVRNRHGLTTGPPPVPGRARTVPPPGLEATLGEPPRAVRAAAVRLRADGRDAAADRFLRAVGALRAEQEVAAIVAELRAHGPADDLPVVMAGAGEREPADVLRIIDSLRELDLGTCAEVLLAVAAAEGDDAVAALVGRLRGEGRTRDLDVLLRAASDARPDPDAVIRLVGALWSTGNRQDLDPLLERATARLTPADAVGLADGLRAAGREETAFGLYARSADVVATRPPVDVAALVATMRGAGCPDQAGVVLSAAILATVTPTTMVDLVVALRAVGLDDAAARALRHAARRSTAADVVSLAVLLRERALFGEALALCTNAVDRRPADEVCVVVRGLLAVGRPIDANRVAERACAGRGPADAVDLLAALRRGGADVAAARALASTATAPVPRMTDLALALRAAGRDADLATVVRMIGTQSTERLVAALVDLEDKGDRAVGPAVLADVTARRGPEELAQLFAVLRREAPRPAGRLLLGLARHPGTATRLGSVIAPVDGSLLALVADQDAAGIARIFTALRDAGPADHIPALLAGGGELSGDQLAGLVAGLRSAGLHDAADRFLHWAAVTLSVRSASSVLLALRRRGHPADADRLRERFRTERGPDDSDRLARLVLISGDPVDAQALSAARPAALGRGWFRRRS